MSLATTEARLLSVLSGVAGMGNVFDRIRSDNDRADAESHYIKDDEVNVWEFQLDTERLPDGAGGLTRNEGVVEILAHFKHDDANDSRGEFRDLIDAASLALNNVDSGFPQIKAPGVQLVEKPTLPVKLRTGQSAYRARLQFRLWDVTNT